MIWRCQTIYKLLHSKKALLSSFFHFCSFDTEMNSVADPDIPLGGGGVNESECKGTPKKSVIFRFMS